MNHSPGFVDIHCHLLPGIDDGAKSCEESLAMARMAVADGITTIVVTPHQLGGFSENHGDLVRQRTLDLAELLEQHQIPLTVLPGADVRIEPGMIGQIQRGEVLTLADRRKHVLLELPHEIYVPLDRLLAELRSAGIVGILSHPERNAGIMAKPSVVGPLVDAGCLMQITAGSLLGAFGSASRTIAERLVGDGLCHFVSTDAHGTKSRRPLLAAAHQRLVELVGSTLADEWTIHNPAAVAAGKPVALGRRSVKPARSGWFGWKKAA